MSHLEHVSLQPGWLAPSNGVRHLWQYFIYIYGAALKIENRIAETLHTAKATSLNANFSESTFGNPVSVPKSWSVVLRPLFPGVYEPFVFWFFYGVPFLYYIPDPRVFCNGFGSKGRKREKAQNGYLTKRNEATIG